MGRGIRSQANTSTRHKAALSQAKSPVSRKALLVFLVVAFGLSWLVDLVPWLLGLKRGTWTETSVLLLGMWGPAFGGIVSTRLVLKRPVLEYLGIHRFKWDARLVVVAIVGPALVALVTTLIALMLCSCDWKWPTENTPPFQFVWAMFLTTTLGLLVNLPGALGEEIGWRGFLDPCLNSAGVRAPLLIGGILWGLWHIPLLVVARPELSGSPLLDVILMPVATTLLHVSLARIRSLSGAIWLSALAHSSINAWGRLPQIMLAAPAHLVASTTGIGGWIPLAGLALFLRFRMGRERPTSDGGR